MLSTRSCECGNGLMNSRPRTLRAQDGYFLCMAKSRIDTSKIPAVKITINSSYVDIIITPFRKTRMGESASPSCSGKYIKLNLKT